MEYFLLWWEFVMSSGRREIVGTNSPNRFFTHKIVSFTCSLFHTSWSHFLPLCLMVPVLPAASAKYWLHLPKPSFLFLPKSSSSENTWYWIFKIYSLSNFQICKTVLTVVAMLYIISQTYLFYKWKLVAFDPCFTHFSPPPLPLTTTDLFSVPFSTRF